MTNNTLTGLSDDEALQAAIGMQEAKKMGFKDLGDPEDFEDFIKYLGEVKKGYKLPFASLTKKFLVAKHELTLISGYTGLGKSELVNQILLECIDQGAKGVITSLELTSNELKKRLFQQATGCANQDRDLANKFRLHYMGKLKYWDGTKLQKLDELLKIMEIFYVEHGHTVFVLDNMMMLGARPGEYEKQYDTVNAIKNFCKEYPVSVFLVAHPRKPSEKVFVNMKAAQPYEFDTPSIYEVSGSATIGNLVDNYLAIGQNTVKAHVLNEIEAGRFDRRDCEEFLKYGDVMLKRGKKREHGEFFNLELFFDKNYRRFKESFTEKLFPYVGKSNGQRHQTLEDMAA